MIEPILSIITPAFNAEKYIEETVQSVLKCPSAVPFEYIVIDDGSSDSTLAILEKYKSQIRLYSHLNTGESETVNVGLQLARGKYILVVNADDPLLTDELISKAYEVLEKNSTLTAAYPDWQIIDELGNIHKQVIVPDYSEEFLIGNVRCLPGPGTVFRKDSAIKIGGRRAKWRYVGDYDFWIRLSQLGAFERIPGILAQWRSSSESTSISQRGWEMAQERVEVIEEFLSEHYFSPKMARMARANSIFLAARLSYFDSRINGRKLAIISIFRRRGWPESATLSVFSYLLLYPLSSKLAQKYPGFFTRINIQ